MTMPGFDDPTRPLGGEETPKCDWKHTPFQTPYKDPIRGMQPGFEDEWTVGCIKGGTIRIEPRWRICPYCGKLINYLTDPNTPGLPNNIPRVV